MPTRRMSWGPWRWNPAQGTLDLDASVADYYLHFGPTIGSAPLLDWIMQVAGKTWATPELLGHLVVALNALFCPQGTVCGGGVDQRVDTRETLRWGGHVP